MNTRWVHLSIIDGTSNKKVSSITPLCILLVHIKSMLLYNFYNFHTNYDAKHRLNQDLAFLSLLWYTHLTAYFFLSFKLTLRPNTKVFFHLPLISNSLLKNQPSLSGCCSTSPDILEHICSPVEGKWFQ